jgi:hypothetical protein
MGSFEHGAVAADGEHDVCIEAVGWPGNGGRNPTGLCFVNGDFEAEVTSRFGNPAGQVGGNRPGGMQYECDPHGATVRSIDVASIAVERP